MQIKEIIRKCSVFHVTINLNILKCYKLVTYVKLLTNKDPSSTALSNLVFIKSSTPLSPNAPHSISIIT